MRYVLITAYILSVAACVTGNTRTNTAGVYQNYTVCPPGATLQADSALIVQTLRPGTQQIVTLINGMTCVYTVPNYQYTRKQ